MKKINLIKIVVVAVIATLSLSFLSSCKNDKESDKGAIKHSSIMEIDLNVHTHQLKDCLNAAEVYIVNTQEEYENLLDACVPNLPKIDFSKHTFVIVWGGTGCLIHKDSEFLENGKNLYDLKVNLHLGLCHSVDLWHSAFCTKTKIKDEATVNLIINEYY